MDYESVSSTKKSFIFSATTTAVGKERENERRQKR